jgi:hypothetical protein
MDLHYQGGFVRIVVDCIAAVAVGRTAVEEGAVHKTVEEVVRTLVAAAQSFLSARNHRTREVHWRNQYFHTSTWEQQRVH